MEVRKVIVGTFASNCYITADRIGGEGMIIDPGAEPVEILRVVKKLDAHIRLIILTHRHPDHVGAAAKVKEATGAHLASHAACAQYLPHSPAMYFPPATKARPNLNVSSLTETKSASAACVSPYCIHRAIPMRHLHLW